MKHESRRDTRIGGGRKLNKYHTSSTEASLIFFFLHPAILLAKPEVFNRKVAVSIRLNYSQGHGI
jgi:hypothetical protein